MNNVPPTKVWTDFPILTMTRSYRLKKNVGQHVQYDSSTVTQYMYFCIKKSVVSEEGRERGCFTFNLFDLHF